MDTLATTGFEPISFIITGVIGAICLWAIAKVFGEGISLPVSLMGAVLVDIISLIEIPFLPWIILYMILITAGKFEAFPGFFATILYGILRIFVISGIAFSLFA